MPDSAVSGTAPPSPKPGPTPTARQSASTRKRPPAPRHSVPGPAVQPELGAPGVVTLATLEKAELPAPPAPLARTRKEYGVSATPSVTVRPRVFGVTLASRVQPVTGELRSTRKPPSLLELSCQKSWTSLPCASTAVSCEGAGGGPPCARVVALA